VKFSGGFGQTKNPVSCYSLPGSWFTQNFKRLQVATPDAQATGIDVYYYADDRKNNDEGCDEQ